jgi:hypothetical protein
MADPATPLILDALAQALAEPAGLPLHAGKATPCLFGSTGPGRRAAQQCLDAGYLQMLRKETRGKSTLDICAITDRGVEYLLAHQSPRPVLEACLRALDQRGMDLAEIILLTRRSQQTLDALRPRLEKAIEASQQTDAPSQLRDEVLTYLHKWQHAHAHEDCPLAELLHHLEVNQPRLTLGQFHDELRALHASGKIYLHAWTGPLHEIPEPEVALLMGHAVAFYASLRETTERT